MTKIDKRDILSTSIRNVEELKRRYNLEKETEINLSNYLSSDILPLEVGKGGTGIQAFTKGSYLVGNGSSSLTEKTTEEVANDIEEYLTFDTSDLAKKPTLLWSNESPTSNFAAQTLELDLSGYSHVLIENSVTSGSSNTYIRRTELFQKGFTATMFNASHFTWMCSRRATVSDTGIVFTTGKYGYVGESGQGDGAQYCIPTKIYGVNF